MWDIIIIPFLGTALGAASVFFFKKEMGQRTQRALTGFASGVMVSASFFRPVHQLVGPIRALIKIVDPDLVCYIP